MRECQSHRWFYSGEGKLAAGAIASGDTEAKQEDVPRGTTRERQLSSERRGDTRRHSIPKEKRLMARYGKTSQESVKRAVRKYKRGELHSGPGRAPVKSHEQAIAIGLPKARAAGAKVPPAPHP